MAVVFCLKVDEQPLPQPESAVRQLNCNAEPYPYGAVDVIVSRPRLRSLTHRVLCLNRLAAVPALHRVLPVPLTHLKVDDLYASGWAQQHWLSFQIRFLRINNSDARDKNSADEASKLQAFAPCLLARVLKASQRSAHRRILVFVKGSPASL